MIAAAKADGEISPDELQRILSRLDQAGVTQEERAFVLAEIARPLDLDGLIAQIRDPRLRVEVYAASLLAIDIDTEAERTYLRELAGRLTLDAATVAALHQSYGAPPPA